MKLLGWNCVHYGVQGCAVDCETVVCVDPKDKTKSQCIVEYNTNAATEIAKRKSVGDMIMCFHGWENKGAAEANNDLPTVEPSIGYDTKAVFAPYRAFTSYAQMHMFYGERGMLMNPSWFDTVIPNAFTASEFEFSSDKKDYILYFGRVVDSKGINIAIQATELSGHRLVIAGPGTLDDLGYKSVPAHVTCFGVADVEQRKILMRDAQAIIGPTYYVEPFGNMVAEGYFSGTPAITTDWGGFTETVVQGVTGYRCREMKEFVNALKNIKNIDSKTCQNWALNNYEEVVVHKKLDEYFKKILQSNFYRE